MHKKKKRVSHLSRERNLRIGKLPVKQMLSDDNTKSNGLDQV